MTEQPACDRPAVILLVNSLGVGGAERQTITLATLLDRYRIVLVYLKPDESLGALVDRDRLADVRSLNVRSRIDLRAARNLAELVTKYDALDSLRQRLRADVCPDRALDVAEQCDRA